MKTIVDVTLKQSKYIFEDDVPIEMEEDRIVTPNFIIGDLNSKNSILYENVTAPDDWFGNKYKYINNVYFDLSDRKKIFHKTYYSLGTPQINNCQLFDARYGRRC